MQRVAVFNWGELSIHTYYLVQQLHKEGISIDLFIYTPNYAYTRSYLTVLLEELKEKINVIEIKAGRVESYVIKLNRVTNLFKSHSPIICINPFLPAKTKTKFNSSSYNHVITVKQSSLYWLYKTDPACLVKTIHYSLEIEKITDPVIAPRSCLAKLIKEEQTILPHVKALIIQDRPRAEALLNCTAEETPLKLVYIPVSVPGCTITFKENYLYRRLKIPTDKKIILYYGGIFQDRRVRELIEVGEDLSSNEFVLVMHGEDDFSGLIRDKEKVKSSNEMVAYDQIYKVIASATIGIAFYDNGWPNTRLTAFSSEKVARYLQAGVPFIAYRNESYLKLQAEFMCCELVEELKELEGAINKIMVNYNDYRRQSYEAYEKYYNIESNIKPLVNFIQS